VRRSIAKLLLAAFDGAWWAIAIVLAALVAWSFHERWEVLASSPFPLGVDGYFYPIEVRSLLEHGTLAYPASPLTMWWMAPFAAITDPITGCKLAAALGGALVALPAFGLGKRLGGNHAAGLVAATVATLSAGSAYLSIEFVKQGIGLTVALAALLSVLRAVEAPSRRRTATAALAIVATLLAHKLAAALVIAIAIVVVIDELRARGQLRGRRLIYTLATVIAVALVLVTLGAISPQRFGSLGDVSRIGALFGAPHWNDAALVRGSYVLSFDHEAFVAVIVALAAGAVLLGRGPVYVVRSESTRLVSYAFVVFALVIGLPWLDVTDPQGLAFRMRVAAFIPLAMSAAIVAGALPGRLGQIACIAACLAIVTIPRDRHEGQVLAHPALVASALALADHVPGNATLVVPERHVEYMIAWYTRAPVTARPDVVPYAQRVRVVLPLSSANAGFPLDAALESARAETSLEPPLDLHPRARDGFVVVTEATWDFILAQLPARTRAHYAAWPTI